MSWLTRQAGNAVKLSSYTPSICVFIAILMVSWFADRQRSTISTQEERHRIEIELRTLVNNIESELNLPIEAARGLVATISSQPDMQQIQFERLAKQTFASSPEIRNVAAARHLVVNLVYPMAGNENTVGLDYHLNEEQRSAAYHVRDTGEFILAGPVNLVQGGQGIIGRFPVFTGNIDRKEFWGILSVVMDLQAVYQNSGLTNSRLETALIGIDGEGPLGEQFLGSELILSDKPVALNIQFPNGSWRIYARPIDGWGSTQSAFLFRVLTFTFGSITLFMAAQTNHMALQRRASIEALICREGELEVAKREAEILARHDHLTGLPNRRYLDDEIRSHASCSALGIIQLDLDGFKSVNDSRGHLFGDQLLLRVANRLRESLPQEAFLARSGGDEFVVVYHFPHKKHINQRRIRHELERVTQLLIDNMQKPFFEDSERCRVGISAGIHQIIENDLENPEEWLSKADGAMYRAKKEGRNRYAFSSISSERSNKTEFGADDLLEALFCNQIVPHYQPQFGPNGTDIIGAEALARWEHPEFGTIMPRCFMGLAETLKLDSVIDQRIFEQVARDLARWDEVSLPVPQVSVNVSSRRLSDPQLISSIDAVAVDPRRMAFELLESIFLDDGNDLIASNVEALKCRGFTIEVDDYGTGHSSATSLLKLRPHCLKIDRSLVQAAPKSRENRHILTTIADTGHALSIKVCAEGIETRQQFVAAKAIGCTKFQGYFFARPMNVQEFEKFVFDVSFDGGA